MDDNFKIFMASLKLYTFDNVKSVKLFGWEDGMIDRKMTRMEFLKMAGVGMFTIFILPGIKKLNLLKKTHKEARYYEKLAG